MFLNIGENTLINTAGVIGIFDLDNTTVSKITRDYLAKNQKSKNIITLGTELPRSFIVYNDDIEKENIIYISPLTSQTLLKRIRAERK